MRYDPKKRQIFTRRALVLGGLKISLLGLITSRMYYLQFIKHDEYFIKSESNHIKYVSINPIRGDILDIQGRKLASNYLFYQLTIIKTREINYNLLIENIAKIIFLSSSQDIDEILTKIKTTPYNNRIILKDHLTWEEIAAIEFNSYALPSVEIILNQFRLYEYKEIISHVTGYIATTSQNDVKHDKFNQLSIKHNLKTGKNGLEAVYDKTLRGEFGQKKLEVDAHSNIIRELAEKTAKNGEDIHSSINIDIQTYLYNLFVEKQGSGVILDISTGHVIAMVSTPSYDPNLFTRKISTKNWQEMNIKNNSSLINKTISNPYPPGSTFKLITALAALDAGVMPTHHIKCTGSVEINGRIFRCWNKLGHGYMHLENALIYSCNVYFYNIAKIIGIDKIANLAKLLGFGQLTNIGLLHEKSGVIPDRAWKYQKFKQPWHLGDTINTAIGQGYCLVTPLQMALSSAKIASGKNIIPSMLSGDMPHAQKLPINEEHLAFIRQAMYKVVNFPGGSAYGNRLDIPTWEMAGKTGTAQVISKNNTDINLSGANIKFSQRNHGIFTGFAPFHRPKYAFSIITEHSGSGAYGAAPLAKSVMQYIYSLGLG